MQVVVFANMYLFLEQPLKFYHFRVLKVTIDKNLSKGCTQGYLKLFDTNCAHVFEFTKSTHRQTLINQKKQYLKAN